MAAWHVEHNTDQIRQSNVLSDEICSHYAVKNPFLSADAPLRVVLVGNVRPDWSSAGGLGHGGLSLRPLPCCCCRTRALWYGIVRRKAGCTAGDPGLRLFGRSREVGQSYMQAATEWASGGQLSNRRGRRPLADSREKTRTILVLNMLGELRCRVYREKQESC